MFKIEHPEIYKTYYILLMKNISGCKKEQINRIYDMKGSTDDRRVLQEGALEDLSIPFTRVCKDLDFLELEKKLYLSRVDANAVKGQLKADTSFLRDLNIIDYSLLVMKVRWLGEPECPYFWGPLQQLPSTKWEGIYYHIALIDISQKWDITKKGEQWWKRILGKKDTSAQQPSTYQARFMKFIREITTHEETEPVSKRPFSAN
jgi:hypothetical protein